MGGKKPALCNSSASNFEMPLEAHRERGRMFREPEITAPHRKSQNGRLNCIPHYGVSINKVAAFTGRPRCVHASVYLTVFPKKCVRPPAQTKSFRSFAITALGAVSQNRENKLESHEEKSFMSDALITKKTSRSPQSRISWLIFAKQLVTTWHKNLKQQKMGSWISYKWKRELGELRCDIY